MKKLITILIIFVAFNGFSQNFAPPGAIWHYSFSSTFLYGVNKYFHDGDTLIQGVQAQKLQKRGSFTFWESGQTYIDQFGGYEYTYADQDHVYQLIGNEFKMLYDFTAQTNDTILIYNSEFYDWTNECDSVGRAIVTETGIEIINGLELRWYMVETLEESTFILNGKIIERIGNTTGSLFSLPSDCIYIQEWIGQFLRCYVDDDFPEYKPPFYDGPCDFITGIDEISNKQSLINFYPNPAKDKLVIEISENIQAEKISIYTIDGKFVLEEPISNHQFEIDISELQSGLYLLKLETEDGFREVSRFIVE